MSDNDPDLWEILGIPRELPSLPDDTWDRLLSNAVDPDAPEADDSIVPGPEPEVVVEDEPADFADGVDPWDEHSHDAVDHEGGGFDDHHPDLGGHFGHEDF